MLFLFSNFIILLLLSNAFLFKEGIWLYQDQSFWFKTAQEAFVFFNTQLHSFNSLSSYLGYDQGILSANNIFIYGIFVILYNIFGSSGSQIAVSLLSYILAFFSFWAFSSIFFKDRKIQLILALLYTFNPLMYSFRGQGLIYAAAPLFIYSFYKFYTSEKNASKYLLLNIFSCFLWVANVRFLEANLFIIIPYLLFALIFLQKTKLYLQKLLLYFVINICIFSPVIYSLLAPLLQRTPSIFNYGTVFNGFIMKGFFFAIFSPFQSNNLILYDSRVYTIAGISLFITVLLFLLKYFNRHITHFLALNIALLVFGMTLFELGYIAGRDFYAFFIKIFPFLTNQPFYGLYIFSIPFIFLLGIIATKNRKVLYSLYFFFVILALIPLLQFSYFPLQKYSLTNLPAPYQNYFVKPFSGIPEATDYVPFDCWRAKYMDQANTPTQCINRGIRYPGIALDNPRTISGEEYYVVKSLYLNPNINNLRVTHNLKNIIVAKDMVRGRDAGPLYSDSDIQKVKELDNYFKKETLLSVKENENFDHFFFKNKDTYDFFLYSPQEIVVRDNINAIFDNSLHLTPLPVILRKDDAKTINKDLQKNVHIMYKQSQFDPTTYYVKLDNVAKDKPFMLHFTQAYKPGWEVVWVDKETYEKNECITPPTQYALTNNAHCEYKNILLDTQILNYFNKKSVATENHFHGNYLTNTWVIDPSTIPQDSQDGSSVYAVILYKNQAYFVLTLLLSGSVLLFVCIYTLIQEGKRLLRK